MLRVLHGSLGFIAADGFPQTPVRCFFFSAPPRLDSSRAIPDLGRNVGRRRIFMGEHDELIARRSEAVSLEYTAAVQYSQHSMLLSGRDKLLFEEIFQDHAKDCLKKAKTW